ASFLTLALLTPAFAAGDPITPFSPDAKWIAFPNDDADKTPEPAPQFRKQFSLPSTHGQLTKATLLITGLGAYDAHINGKPVSDHVLDPGWTTYSVRVLYNSFDVTNLLRPGDNAIGVTLGNGPYNCLRIKGRYSKFNGTFGVPKLCAQLTLDFSDGSHQTLSTDNSWKTTRGPIIYNHQFGGEDYDARRETPGWTEPDFNDKSWKPAALIDPPGNADGPAKITPALQPPDKICQTFTPQKVTQPQPGVFVVDLGQNAAAWPDLSVSGPAGATIKLIPGELLDNNGLVTQRTFHGPVWYAYTLAGHGTESWHPLFSATGFRYVQVEGADTVLNQNSSAPRDINGRQVTVESLSSQFIHADLPEGGTFSSSDQTLNQIHKLINMAILSNSQSVLTDCPHREKLGWLEQAHLMAHAIMMNWDVRTLYDKIADDISDAQHPDGLVPEIAPEFSHFKGGFLDSPEWASASIIAPWYTYLFYGDKQILADHYDTMKRYEKYLAGTAHDNIIDHGLGDWYDIGPKSPGVAQLTSKALTGTAVWYQDLTTLEKIATLLNKPEDAQDFATRAEAVKKTFNEKFFHPDTHQYENASQTANAMPLALNLVPDNERSAVLHNLVQIIADNKYHVTAGDVGFSYVVRALTDAGQGETLYHMATQSDGPGYVMQLRKGATALTEAWDASPHSNNHLMLGHIESWFFEGLGGIQPDPDHPGFSHFFLRPQFPTEVPSINTTHNTPHGQITSNWKRNANKITCTFTIPQNTTATVNVGDKSEDLSPGTYTREYTASPNQ
ncbi:MAG: family 78 glycoside hydrolase catalytic domain, partial [Phycisphaerae bacterium]